MKGEFLRRYADALVGYVSAPDEEGRALLRLLGMPFRTATAERG